jgi:hypothetical protein
LFSGSAKAVVVADLLVFDSQVMLPEPSFCMYSSNVALTVSPELPPASPHPTVQV